MQVEWTPYMTSPRALLNEHPRTTYIGGITCFDIIEVYFSERTVRQLGFVQAITPLLSDQLRLYDRRTVPIP